MCFLVTFLAEIEVAIQAPHLGFMLLAFITLYFLWNVNVNLQLKIKAPWIVLSPPSPSNNSNLFLFWLIGIVVSAWCALHRNDTSRCALNHSIPVSDRVSERKKTK